MRDYDYTQAGAYFVTVCAQDRACLFGEIVDGEMRLNAAGEMVAAEWQALVGRFPGVELDGFTVMPNHIHAIVVLVGAGLVPARTCAGEEMGDHEGRPYGGWGNHEGRPYGDGRPPPTLGDVMGAFKSITTVSYTRGVKQSTWPGFRGRLWQRNYYEHIIRDTASLHGIREYIANNPLQWALDRENPINVGAGVVPASDRATTRVAPTVDGTTTRVAPTAWDEF
ncbi:transposase [Algiphilus sp. W345]|uniref:Transposase n=1 Tax=Banduia mediterranea TaxID=3075609 RepID=A0ABU2WMM5_9GAMM|nr:transposase [Algiphilus sp. W345]MDT0499133.1 transposase [Algiphilus sp. W345]